MTPETVKLAVEATQQLSVTFNPTNATNKDITWASDDVTVATVDTKGLVTAVAEGTATITATSKNGKTATCKVAVGNLEVVTKVTKADLTSDGYTEESVKKVNFDNLTVAQKGAAVTITGKDLVKVTQEDFPLDGFGGYTIPGGITSKQFALVAWNIGPEAHVWIIGNATKNFDVTYKEVTYTINVEGLDWAADIKAATKANLTAESASTEKINYDNLIVTRDGYDVSISGKVAKKVQDGDKVDGFGTIEVPEGAKSKQYALIAWMVDTELHIWAVGNETETFTFEWEGLEYTVDVKGLDWYEEVTRTEAQAPTRADSTGGEALVYDFKNGTLTISAPIASIPKATSAGSEEGYHGNLGKEAQWVGVNIPKPTTDVVESGTIKLTIKEDGKDDIVHTGVTYGVDDPFLYYFGAEPGGRTLTLEIVWNATHKETLVVKYVDTTEPVYGSMTAYPYANGAAIKDGNNYTATFSGEIPWYDATTEGELPRAEGNRVGVKIIMPEDEGYNPANIVEIKIGENTYEWDTIKDDAEHFQWWPLVTEANQEFTATIKWNSASEQTFKIVVESGILAKDPVKVAAKAAIKPSWKIGPVEVAGNDLPEGVVDDGYKVTIKTSYENKTAAQNSGRTVTTFFTIPEGVTVWYPVWADGKLSYTEETEGEVAYGMVGHPLNAGNIDADGIVYVSRNSGVTETDFNFTIKLVDAVWDGVVYGENEELSFDFSDLLKGDD